MSDMKLKQWDGRTWFIPEPEGFVRGLYKFSQLEAHDLLKLGRRLNEWEARFLQTVFYQHGSLSHAQRHWLRWIGKRHGISQVAA
ncbi:hypothetical protein [Qipengyuania huizhouensis]|uniref:hypothetical protein n=1 Tax=Qipengyuania huizhouensis TaxID=2867245 RepID=UPI001C86F935|nr:hypothetical protein [Qipengyuania huizhouensis]MBX7461771.1 hypothetical protein [Qipengyuania huizhouensis]